MVVRMDTLHVAFSPLVQTPLNDKNIYLPLQFIRRSAGPPAFLTLMHTTPPSVLVYLS